jgi:hypothetical protein
MSMDSNKAPSAVSNPNTLEPKFKVGQIVVMKTDQKTIPFCILNSVFENGEWFYAWSKKNYAAENMIRLVTPEEIGLEPTQPAPEVSMQSLINVGLNGFALELLSESLRGKDKTLRTFKKLRFTFRGVTYTLEPASGE